MSEISYLHDQAARAERLCNGINDTLTIERLKTFAAECRRKIAQLQAAVSRAA